VSIGRLILVVLAALILSAPATAAVSPDGLRVQSAGDLLDLAGDQVAGVVAGFS